MQVKCLAQWLGESEDPGNRSEGKAEFLLGLTSGMRIKLRMSHRKGESMFA